MSLPREATTAAEIEDNNAKMTRRLDIEGACLEAENEMLDRVRATEVELVLVIEEPRHVAVEVAAGELEVEEDAWFCCRKVLGR
jgi:hypothetical protein